LYYKKSKELQLAQAAQASHDLYSLMRLIRLAVASLIIGTGASMARPQANLGSYSAGFHLH